MTTELNRPLCDPVLAKAGSRELHKAGIYGRAAIRKPLISKEHKTRTPEHWQNVVWNCVN
uniref:Uncharacterized protein n=1 Tax=Esox lucius TaxID=8010 RepID=A0AAY5L6P4_ESOLU